MISSVVMTVAAWVAVLVKAISLRRGQDVILLVCFVILAFSFTLGIPALIPLLDAPLGGHNAVDLIRTLLFSVGIYLLSASIMRSTQPAGYRTLKFLAQTLLLLVIVAEIYSFSRIDAPSTVTEFMANFGDQSDAVAYRIAGITYTSLVLELTAVVCLVYWRRMKSRRFKIGLLMTGIGCVIGILSQLSGLELIVRNFYDDLGNLSPVGASAQTLDAAAVTIISVGMTIPAFGSRLERRSRDKTTQLLLADIEPLWENITGKHPHLVIRAAIPQDADTRLHRMLVEIRDCFLADSSLEADLSPNEHDRITRAESHLNRA